jgi:hypothetical protein
MNVFACFQALLKSNVFSGLKFALETKLACTLLKQNGSEYKYEKNLKSQ